MKSLEFEKKSRKRSIVQRDAQAETDGLTTIDKLDKDDNEVAVDERDSSVGNLGDDEEEEEELKDPKDQ